MLLQAMQLLPGAHQQQDEGACRWHDYQTASRISSWEFQMRSTQARTGPCSLQT